MQHLNALWNCIKKALCGFEPPTTGTIVVFATLTTDILTWGPVLKPVWESLLLSSSIKTCLIQLVHFGANNKKATWSSSKVVHAQKFCHKIEGSVTNYEFGGNFGMNL